MAKKKAARKAKSAKKAVKKKAVRKTPAGKAPAKKKKPARKKPAKKKAAKKKTPAKKATRKSAGTKTAVKKKAAKTSRPMPLGRPKVTLDSKLEQLFLRDLEVREVCEFLGVTTLRDLEQYRADEIVEKLTAPVVSTVSRMRKTLAMTNRCLKGDQKFAKDFKKQVEAQMKKKG